MNYLFEYKHFNGQIYKIRDIELPPGDEYDLCIDHYIKLITKNDYFRVYLTGTLNGQYIGLKVISQNYRTVLKKEYYLSELKRLLHNIYTDIAFNVVSDISYSILK